MRSRLSLLVASFTVSLIAVGIAVGQDKYALTVPNGLSFGDIRGYETWQVIAPSYRTDKTEIRFIVGNDVALKAYRAGVPANGKAFPDGAMLVKVAWSQQKLPEFPAAIVPDVLQRIEFMVKDSKRFADTSGWGYARFVYDAKTGAFKAYGTDKSFVQECHTCHLLVEARDYVFTRYGAR